MRNLSSTELKQLEFVPSEGKTTNKTIAVTNKIGWIHTIADRNGSTFDIKIKDAIGRTKFERLNCKTDTKEYGELVNQNTLMGEELEVTIENLKGAKKLQVFIN